MRMRLLVAGLVLALSGCSTVGGWFGAGSGQGQTGRTRRIQADRAALAKAWKVDTGDTAGYLFHPQADGDDVFAAGGSRVVRIAVASGNRCGAPTPA